MSYDPYQPSTTAATTTVDAGLQSYMRGVFNTMTYGLGVTGLTAWAVASIEPLRQVIFGTPLAYVAMFAPLVFLWVGFRPGRIEAKSAYELRVSFLLFSAVMGLSLASIFMVYAQADIARAFFITAATFAATSLYGYTTKRDLTGMGSFLFMGLIGIFIASLVNIFLKSTGMQFIISIVGCLVFTGLTAFEVQRLKETYSYARGMEEASQKFAIMGALNLYLNFVNLFQIILSLTAGRRD